MIAPTYTGKGGYVWKEPVETKHPDGISSFALGFRVCKMMPEVGDDAASTLAEMLNTAERADAEAAIKADLLEALDRLVKEVVLCGYADQSGFEVWLSMARIAMAKATGQGAP